MYLELDVEERDRYARLLAYVYLENGRMLNELLIKEGYGTVLTIPPNNRYEQLFTAAQNKAKKNALGSWSVCR